MCEGCLSSWNKKESRDGAGETTVCSYCKALVEGIPSRAYTSEGRSSCCTREDSRREGSSRCAKKVIIFPCLLLDMINLKFLHRRHYNTGNDLSCLLCQLTLDVFTYSLNAPFVLLAYFEMAWDLSLKPVHMCRTVAAGARWCAPLSLNFGSPSMMHLEEKKGEIIWEYRIDKASVDSSGD